jgi:hypothetical protein
VIDQVQRLLDEGREEESYELLVRLVQVAPDHPAVLAYLRDALMRRRKFELSLVLAKRVVEVAPRDGAQWDRLGGAYLCLDRFAEAEEAIKMALELSPEMPSHWHQAALMAHRQNRSIEALRFIVEGLNLAPYSRPLKHDLAHIKLALGENLPDALTDYEVRWDTLVHLRPWDYHIPEWHGEPLDGKSILFHSEQGFGDAIMLARFARNLAARGAEVGLCLPPELTRLFAAQRWRDVRVVDMLRIEPSEWNLQTPMFSALRHLGLQRTEIDPNPYLTEVPRVVVPKLPDGFKVGICWASGRWNVDTGLRRMVPLELFLPLLIPGIRLVSLQKGEGAADVQRLGLDGLIADPMAACGDFAATAAIVNQLDAVVTVDTAVMHLAAAMGKPTFMLCQFTRCWRWWELPSGFPWYESLQSSQQIEPHDWVLPAAAAIEWVKAQCQS